jgi:multidrug efflux pump subunit AcrB
MDVAGFSVRNWQFTLVMLLMLMALGFQALRDIPRSEDPELNAPNYAIIAVFPGATPTDVESLVVDPLEARLASLSRLKRMKTNIDGNVAFIALEFEIGVDPEQRYGDVVREVNAARTDLPDEVARLDIIELRPTLVNAFEVALGGPQASTTHKDATNHLKH